MKEPKDYINETLVRETGHLLVTTEEYDQLKHENERLRATLAKIRDANPASTLAHPQNVWWRCHVQKWAKDALDGGET